MKQSVKLFAVLKDLAGDDEVILEFESAPTVRLLREKLAERLPQLRPLLPVCTVAVNNQYVSDAAVIAEDAEVALLPPVSGG